MHRDDKIESINTLDFSKLVHQMEHGVTAQRLPLVLTEIFKINLGSALANILIGKKIPATAGK